MGYTEDEENVENTQKVIAQEDTGTGSRSYFDDGSYLEITDEGLEKWGEGYPSSSSTNRGGSIMGYTASKLTKTINGVLAFGTVEEKRELANALAGLMDYTDQPRNMSNGLKYMKR